MRSAYPSRKWITLEYTSILLSLFLFFFLLLHPAWWNQTKKTFGFPSAFRTFHRLHHAIQLGLGIRASSCFRSVNFNNGQHGCSLAFISQPLHRSPRKESVRCHSLSLSLSVSFARLALIFKFICV